eukprot:gene739-917_t
MSALARWFQTQGTQVFGYEKRRSTLTDQLEKEGMTIHFEPTVEAIPFTILSHPTDSLVLYTPSISPTHPILAYLVGEEKYTLAKRGKVLEAITQQYTTLAIAGTHGKTSSTALAAHILSQTNNNMVAFLGGIAKNYDSNFIVSQSEKQEKLLVIEADEFDRFFLQLHPKIAIVTTVDPDHLDTFGDQEGFEAGFKQFLDKLPPTGIAILHCEVANRLKEHLPVLPAKVLQYALKNAPIYAHNVAVESGIFTFDYVSDGMVIKDIRLSLPGYHYVENALAVITACLQLGVPPEAIREAVASFQGVARRYDPIIQRDDLVFIDDYGHHPVEIKALLTTVRALHPGKKITVIFRPNQYSRTKHFLDETAESLNLADCVFVLDIYTDREVPLEGINPEAILNLMTITDKYACTKENLIQQLPLMGKPEVVVNVGAGDADELIIPIKKFLLEGAR